MDQIFGKVQSGAIYLNFLAGRKSKMVRSTPLGCRNWKKEGWSEIDTKNKVLGHFDKSNSFLRFLITIFEFFGNNAADWCRRCIEIRISDMEHFAPKFRIWPFWVDKLLKIKGFKKLQNMFVRRPGCSGSATEWFLETNNSYKFPKSCIFAIVEWFCWSQLACSNAITASIKGCFAPPPVQGAEAPTSINWK